MNAPFADFLAKIGPDDPVPPIFPVRVDRKEPATPNGHKDAARTHEDLKNFAANYPADSNIGFVPELAGLCVVDVDGPDGEAGLFEQELQFGQIPPTYEVKTPRGRHLYFRGSLPPTASKIAKHVDSRGIESYVLAAGSIVNGVAYVEQGNAEAATLPEWIARRAHRQVEKHLAAGDVELDLPGNIARAVTLCAQCVERGDVAVEGQGGDDRTYRLACAVMSLGLSPEKALEIIRDNFNPHCQPPWADDELQVKVRNAADYMQNEPGAWAVPPAEELFAEFVETQGALVPVTGTASRFSPVSFGDVLKREVPPVQELIGGLVEKGTVTFLSAPGGSHKSRLALQWGLSIDAGVSIFGRSVEQSRFVCLSYEDHADEVARRVQSIAQRLSLPMDSGGEFWDLSGKDAPLAAVSESGEIAVTDFGNRFIAYLKSIAMHKFVTVDSTYNAIRFIGAAKINEGAVMAAIGWCQRICDETDSTMLVLWHPSQAGQERGDASGWSVAWHNAPRARLSLGPVKDTEDAFDLKVEKRNHGPKGKPLTLHWCNGVLLPRSETDSVEQKGTLLRAAVRVAIMSAQTGAPIQRQRRLTNWQIEEIEREIGRRPTEREAKEALASALPAGLLRYIAGSQRCTAGYYPADQSAEDLARGAKLAGAGR